MTRATDITIVGAGPYGLSIAAHLRERGIDFRIIGSPMQTWRSGMPKGMLLKSAGFSSSLHDPGRTFPLRVYCRERGIPYEDVDFPIALDTFCEYGLAFQRRFVPDLEEEQLASLARCADGFELILESGAAFRSRKVVLAVGIDHFRHVPEALSRLPAGLLSHSAEHHELGHFHGREVVVLGSGASAIDLAVLLHEAQARVRQIVRKPYIDFGGPWAGRSPSLWRRIREPVSAIGPGWRSRLCVELPWLYRHLPDDLRVHIARHHLGPSGGWFMQDRAASVPALLGYEVQQAQASGSRVKLRLVSVDGASVRQIAADHVIAATGYRADVARLPFLDPEIVEGLQLIERAPRLSAHFESSVPGLYFAGPIAANTFGPVMRFAAGAEFASRAIARHLARSVGAHALRLPAARVPKLH